MVLCVQCSKPISGDHNRCLSFSHSITKSVMPANPPVFTESKATTYVVLPEFLQKCPESRASLTSALPALTLQPLHASQLCLEWPFSCSKSKMKAQSGLVVLMIREQAMRRKTEQEAWGSGPGDLHQSPLRVQLLALITDYKASFDLILPKTLHWHGPDLLASTPGRSLLGSLGNNSKCAGSVHAWRRPAVPRPIFHIPVILPSGSGRGVCNKEIILKKNMEDNH